MSTEPRTKPSVEAAIKLLKQYSCVETKKVETTEDKQQLQEALILITSLSEYQNFGICADNSEEARGCLLEYLKALGYNTNLQNQVIPESNEPVYVKFNTQKMSHYLDSYSGTYRGVLVSCQSEDEAIMGTYGYFPLDLFKA